jgi:hypothetical protein
MKPIKPSVVLTVFVILAIYLTVNNFLFTQKYGKYLAFNRTSTIAYPSFCVITTVFNPASYKSRYWVYRFFRKHVESFGVRLVTVELAIGNQIFNVTEPNNTDHVQLRTDDILWYKENLVNIGAKKMATQCEYFSWIDADMVFENKHWVDETISALEQYKIVQLFENVNVLGPNGRTHRTHTGLSKCTHKTRNCAPGGGWACKKETFLSFGGLWDVDIVGDADGVFARGCFGLFSDGEVERYQPDYLHLIQRWQLNLNKYIKSSVSHISGNISHIWHGSRENRGLMERKEIVNSLSFPFKPYDHVYYDVYGLLHFKPEVRDHFMNLTTKYFLNRKEDSNAMGILDVL